MKKDRYFFLEHAPKGNRKCSKCVYGDENFWGYAECWLTEKRIDRTITEYTAIREKDAKDRNNDGHCEHYKRRKIKILWWSL